MPEMPQTALKLFGGLAFREWGILSVQALVLKDGFLGPVLSFPRSYLKLRGWSWSRALTLSL